LKRLLLLVFVGFYLAVPAQDKVVARTKPPAPSFFLTTIPIRAVLRDYNIGFSKRIGWSHTFECRIGYVHHNKILDEYYSGWFTSTEMKFSGPSIYFQLNKWKYTLEQKRYYWGMIVGYRYLSYTDQKMWMGGIGGSSVAEELQLSQWRNDLILMCSIGFNSTKFTTTEIAIGLRVMQTHTHAIDTRFHPSYMTPAEYEAYKVDEFAELPNSKGLTLGPLIRVTSRVGWFGW